MKRRHVLSAVLIALLPVACENAPLTDPIQADAQFAKGSNGLHLRDTDSGDPMPADTTVGLQDTIRMALAAGNGNGPQNNKNVEWSSSDQAVVALSANKGTAVAIAQALGTSVVCATLGGNSVCVTVHVDAGPGDHYIVTSSSYAPNAGDAVTITAQLVDVANNPVGQSGRIVSWSSTNGGSFSAPTSITDGSGVATISFTTSTIAWTDHVVTGVDNFGQSGATASIVTQTGPAADIVLTTPQTTVLAGSTITITAQLLDQHANPILAAGVAVNWSSTNGGSFASNPTVTDANGQTTVDFTVANTVVTHDITATSGAASGMIQVTTFNNPPIAGNDVFHAIGNVTIPVSAPGVLANDSDGETSASAVAGVVTTANGGTVNLNADGSFTYLSAAGFTGTDTWTYTVTDGSLTANATVTMTVPNRVWFVKNDATAPGDGRDASPFVQLGAAQTATAVNETIYVYRGDGTTTGYDAGFVFKNGQSLIGQGFPVPITAVLNGETVTVFAADGNAPSVTRATPGTTVQLAQNNTLQGFSISSSAGTAMNGSGFGIFAVDYSTVAAMGGPALMLDNGSIAGNIAQLSSSTSPAAGVFLTSVGGNLTAPAGNIAGSTGTAFFVSGGSGTIKYGGTITTASGFPVEVQNRTGGLVELSGAISSTFRGIRVLNNANSTVRFSGPKTLVTGSNPGVVLVNNIASKVEFNGGGLAITTSGAHGFMANAGGTLTVTGANNTIASVSAPALDVQNTPVGTTGLNFERISANGGPNGIVLINTGASPALTVTGTGTAGSGGVIQNMTGSDGLPAGNGVYLSGAQGVSLAHMQLGNHSNHAIRGTNVNGFELVASTVNGTNGNNAALHEGSIVFEGLTGNASIENSTVSGGLTDNIRVTNTSGVLDRLTVAGSTIGLNHIIEGRHGLLVHASGTGTANVTIQSSNFLGARGSLFLAQAHSGGSGDVVLSGNSFINSHPNTAPGGGNVAVDGFGTGFNITYAISGNTFQNALGTALVVGSTGAGSLTGSVHNNDIGAALIANSGSTQGAGLSINVTGGATHTAILTNNRVRQYNNQGILLQIGDNTQGGNGTLNATLTGNTVSNPGTSLSARNGIHLNAGTITGDNPNVCLVIGGPGALANTINGSGTGGAAGTDFRLRQRMLTTVTLPGYLGANNDNAAVTLFVQNNNGVTPTGLTQNTVATGGGGFVNGPACPTS